MYVKVHKTENQWFRDDNGALIGSDINVGSKTFNHLKILLGDNRMFVKTDDTILPIFHGYFRNNMFFRFCTSKDCISCTAKTKTLFCSKIYDNAKKVSGGYYIIT